MKRAPKEEMDFLAERVNMPRLQLRDEFNARFGTNLTVYAIHGRMWRHGLSGSLGRRMDVPLVSDGDWRDRVTLGKGSRGYPVVRHKGRLRYAHILAWEEAHGPIPKGYRLACKGDKENWNPDNWELMPIGAILKAVLRSPVDYVKADPETKQALRSIAKLEHMTREKKT